MATTSQSVAFDCGVRPMLEIALPEKADAVIGFQADPDQQARIELRSAEILRQYADAHWIC